MHTCVHMCHDMCVDIRGLLVEVYFLLPPYETYQPNLGPQARLKVSFPFVPLFWSTVPFYMCLEYPGIGETK